MRRHPVGAYFILACAISWAAVSPLVAAWLGLGPPIAPAWHGLGAVGPITAAFLVTFATAKEAGLRELWGRMIRWRVGVAWWALAIGSPLALWALAATLLGWESSRRVSGIRNR